MFCRFHIPLKGFGIILLHSVPVLLTVANQILSSVIALIGRFFKPLKNLTVILADAAAAVIMQSESALSFRKPLIGSLSIPL